MPETLLDYRRPTSPQEAAGVRARFRWLTMHWAAVAVDVVVSVVIALLLGMVCVPSDKLGLRIAVMAGAWLPLAVALYLLGCGLAWLMGRLIENNYKSLLIGRYLRRRRIAWVSLIAVTLCTTMVLVVISVMGGWLDMFETSARGLSADLIIRSNSLAGFAGYEQIIEKLRKDPDVVAAVPTLDTWGLLNITNRKTDAVHILGFPIDQIGQVNKFPDSLYRQRIEPQDRLDAIPEERRKTASDTKLSAGKKAQELQALDEEAAREKNRLSQPPSFNLHDPVDVTVFLPNDVKMLDADKGILDTGDAELSKKVRFDPWGLDGPRLLSFGPLSDGEADKLRSLSEDKSWGRAVTELARESHWPGMISATGPIEIYMDKTGKLEGRVPGKHHLSATLMVLGVTRDGHVDPENRADRSYWIMDDSHTGMWQYDQNTVYVPFDVLQADLGMGASEAISKLTGKPFTEPARTHEIHVKLRPGADVEKVKIRVQERVVDPTMVDLEKQAKEVGESTSNLPVYVQTWRDAGAQYIQAIEHEKVLVVVLFAIISIVAIFLIFCIFYMIVAEKTRDIGIIKSVGATNTGVAGIFLGYGLVIGVVGGALALLCSYGIIHNINELHALMGKLMGVRIWSPEVYAFDRIPSTMNPTETLVIVSIAVLSSVLGALIPAIRAARLNPVEALRWE